MSAPPTREPPLGRGGLRRRFAASPRLYGASPSFRGSSAPSLAECEMCRRAVVDSDAAEQHAARGHVVLATVTTVTAHGCPSDVDRLILARLG